MEVPRPIAQKDGKDPSVLQAEIWGGALLSRGSSSSCRRAWAWGELLQLAVIALPRSA